jgi:putative hydrolase of the HAD superfamily/5'-nucleotidase
MKDLLKPIKDYTWILFDADDTLFHFDAFSGLQRMFAGYQINFTADDYAAYQLVNKPLWVQYQNGEISAQQLQHRRFQPWAVQLQVPAQSLNSAYMAALADICTPVDGATSLLAALKGKVKLGIITNGFTELQRARLDRTGLRHHFDVLVISEEIGVAKPHRDIFDHALALMDDPEREQVLMVGDNPDSDIVGGINAGLQTCWVNVDGRAAPEGVAPHYEVRSLGELENLLVVS